MSSRRQYEVDGIEDDEGSGLLGKGQRSEGSSRRWIAIVAVILLVGATVGVAWYLIKGRDSSSSSSASGSSALASRVTSDKIVVHLYALEALSAGFPANSRSMETGYNASVDYVLSYLRNNTDYDVRTVPFRVPKYTVLAPPSFNISFNDNGPQEISFVQGTDFVAIGYSGSGNLNASIRQVAAGTLGCDASDYAGIAAGHVVLIPRGNCSFYDKIVLANTTGCVAVIISNNVAGLANIRATGPQGETFPFPLIQATQAFAQSIQDFLTDGTPVYAAISTSTLINYTVAQNIIADTRHGRGDKIIVVGSHLDSVDAGPGINDNGSGSATNMEMAVQLFKLGLKPVNKVRFAWWGAEEIGLVGSSQYVAQIVATGELSNISLNLNFDMLASPNFFRGVYDGASGTPYGERVANGSTSIQRLFEERFEQRNLAFNLTSFDGRSDYGPFIENAIPAGGLFTGAEDVKDMNERAIYGGLANAFFDPCYHQRCDTVGNLNLQVLGEMADAASYVLQKLMMMEDLDEFLFNHGHEEPTTPKP